MDLLPSATNDDYDNAPDSDEDLSGELDDDNPADLKHEPTSPASTPETKGGKNSNSLQKRRRVTRACDECRRKKIKCDGKQPCTHCTVYSYECTYDQPSNRRRNPAPQYVENLEYRVHRAETLLHILIPNLDLNDPGIDAAVAQGWIPGAPGKGNPPTLQKTAGGGIGAQVAGLAANKAAFMNSKAKPDTDLESMVRAVAQLDMDENGYWDYHGHSSGLSFVRRMREQLGDLMGPEVPSTPFVKSRPRAPILDSPRSFVESPSNESASFSIPELPPIELARNLCQHAVNDAAALLRVVHQPSFWTSFESLYATPHEHYTNEHNTFLPLFHSVLALGHLFAKDENNTLGVPGYESAIQRGFTHFKAARQLMDITDCRDLTSIQAVIFMILFLQSSAKLSQCYAYVGVALRSALRMGLHRAHAGNFGPIEAEVRKRVFWIVRKLDIYVGAMLGLPQTLSDEDIDQDFPSEVDDEYITKDGMLPQPEGQVSLMAAFNAHTRLVQLLSKIVRKIYPIKVQGQPGRQDKSYSVPFSAIREIEGDLEEWKNSLPPILSPCVAPPRYTRIQQLLRLSYAHAQVMLYRPFLHFTAMEKRSKPIDQRAYACGASFVNVSRNIIHITSQMKEKGLLNGAHWFIMYTTFFSILALVYFAAENPDNTTTQAVMSDAQEGRQVLASLATTSMAADRCTATLDFVFQKLPQWLREGHQRPVATRKRHLDDSTVPFVNDQAQPLSSRSFPDVAQTATDIPDFGPPKRASTFPRQVQLAVASAPASPWSHSGESSYGPQTPTSAAFDPQTISQYGQPNVPTMQNPPIHQQQAMAVAYGNAALPDLSAMMFPTADEPFVYPNQPLTTFENTQQVDQGYKPFSYPDMPAPDQPIALSQSTDDNLEAQFFALPPYIEQRQQEQQQQQHQQRQRQRNAQSGMGFPNRSKGYLGPGPANNVVQMPGTNQMWVNQDTTGQVAEAINIGNIFGGNEWNSMLMNTGYQGQ